MQRIVITGLGVISPIGNTIEAFRANLFAGKSGIGTVTFPVRGKEIQFPGAPVQNLSLKNISILSVCQCWIVLPNLLWQLQRKLFVIQVWF